MGYKDARREPRISYLCHVDCEGVGPSSSKSLINELSTTGAYIDLVRYFKVGSTVRLRFRVDSVEIDVRAEVCHSKPGVGIGVRFLDLRPEHRDAIERAIVEAVLKELSSTADIMLAQMH